MSHVWAAVRGSCVALSCCSQQHAMSVPLTAASNTRRSICLDCIVTVVDARHVRRQLADPRPDGGVNEAQQQVAFADVVLLNKVRRRLVGVGNAVCRWLAKQCVVTQQCCAAPLCRSAVAASTAWEPCQTHPTRALPRCPLHRPTWRTSSSCGRLRARSGG